jgi:aminoglycoside 6'-N-acetyltransferase
MQRRYVVRSVVEADRPFLLRWRAMPQVVRWWGDPDEEDEPEPEEAPDPRIAMWVAELDRRPFAFIQDYAVADWSPHHFDYLPAGSRGMDIYIGEADLLGLGHGSRLVRQHVESLFERGAPAVGIDPHPDNVNARRAFERAGFRFRSGPSATPWGRVILMDRFAEPM